MAAIVCASLIQLSHEITLLPVELKLAESKFFSLMSRSETLILSSPQLSVPHRVGGDDFSSSVSDLFSMSGIIISFL
jgi:hypothetical protein